MAEMNFDVLHHPKVHRIYNDAREVLLTTPNHYDIIVSEPSNPYRAGVATLFTREFYESAADRLNSGGIFVQWLQGYEISRETVETVFATVTQTFEHVQVWQGGMADMLLVCTHDRLPIDVAALRAKLATQPFRDALLDAWAAVDIEGVLSRHIATDSFANRLVKSAPTVNTDDHNSIEYGFARSLGSQSVPFWIQLREEAVAHHENHPEVAEAIDWKRVDELANDVFFWPKNTFLDGQTPTDPKATDRASGLIAYSSGNMAGLMQADFAINPRGPLETIAVAHAMIHFNHDLFEARLKTIKTWNLPSTVHLLQFLWYFQRNETDAAKAELLTSFESLRHDPYVFPMIINEALEAAIDLSYADHDFAQQVYVALKTPFCASVRLDSANHPTGAVAGSGQAPS